MAYITQGTVQVTLDKADTTVVNINPISDYMVKDGDKEYTVFVMGDRPENVRAQIFGVKEQFTVAGPTLALVALLQSAALQSIKVEIELKETGKKWNIVAVKVPADRAKI